MSLDYRQAGCEHKRAKVFARLLADDLTADIADWNLVQKVFDQGYFNRLDSIKAAARDSSGKSFDINDKRL
jgi:hypothetical protein